MESIYLCFAGALVGAGMEVKRDDHEFATTFIASSAIFGEECLKEISEKQEFKFKRYA